MASPHYFILNPQTSSSWSIVFLVTSDEGDKAPSGHTCAAAAVAAKLLQYRVQLCATPQTADHEAPLSLGFSRQEHWSGVLGPSPQDTHTHTQTHVHAQMHTHTMPWVKLDGLNRPSVTHPWTSNLTTSKMTMLFLEIKCIYFRYSLKNRPVFS